MRGDIPFGCRWCGEERGRHGRRWTESAGVHAWEEPPSAVILRRMRLRREERIAARDPILGALRLIWQDMERARSGGDEWAEEWMLSVWGELPPAVRAAAERE